MNALDTFKDIAGTEYAAAKADFEATRDLLNAESFINQESMLAWKQVNDWAGRMDMDKIAYVVGCKVREWAPFENAYGTIQKRAQFLAWNAIAITIEEFCAVPVAA